MQSSPLVSVDMMSAGPPASSSAAKTGQDGIFASHLAAASQGQTTTTPQAQRASNQESPPTSDEQIQDAGNGSDAQPKEVLNTQETGNDIAGKTTASDDTTGKGDSNDDLTSGATQNSSAGAANAATIPLLWTGPDIGFTLNQSIAKTPNNESTLSRMLDAITLAAKGAMGAPQTNSLPAQAKAEATPILQTDPAVQAFTLEAKQPLLPTNQPLAATGVAVEAITVPNASSSGNNSIAGNDPASLQSLITASFVSDATPAVEAASLTEKTTIASPSVTAQTQPAAIQTPDQQNPEQPGVDKVVQNKYGQIITIYQASESQEMVAATTVDSKQASMTTSKTIDANNNFLQSHLANGAAQKPLEKESGSQQQDTAKDNQQKGANSTKTITNVPIQPEQLTPQTSQLTVGTENQSLIFHNQQVGTPLISTPLADASSLRLPSGLTVPGETVVDQLISHFSVNNRLESGTVNLKLHPQELGELRMEIKITQDAVKAHFIAQTPHAQEMITQHLPRLREALEQQGLHLQQIEVTIATNDNSGRDQFQGHTGQQQLNQSMHNSRGSQPLFSLDTGEEAPEATQLINNLSVMA